MKKSLFKRIVGFGLACIAAISMVACSGNGNKDDSKKDDPTKTKLKIFTYKAGYGDEWLNRLEDAFEKAFANVSFEEGKTGVLVEHAADMLQFNAAQVQKSEYDIFFFENEHYYKYIDVLEDLTDIVNAKASADDAHTVLEKLDSQQTGYYGAKVGNETHYYALPSYFGNYGIIYNKDLFEQKGYYLAADKSNGAIIGSNKNAKKTNGPDGLPNTPDDGLPATYQEFFTLCDEIFNANDTPVCWPGKYRQHHLGNLMDNLISDYEGVEQMRINYDFDGTVAKDLVVLDANGKVTKDSNGNIVTEEKAINSSNGYDVARQIGKLYAMQFIEKLITNVNYYNKDAFTGSFSHTDNQELFLMAGTEDFGTDNRSIAMLIDGPWWQEESDGVFTEMEKAGSQYARNKRNFGWMPLPKATADKVGQGNVYSDYLNAFVCVKGGLSEGVKKAAKEFVKFSCTDAMLRDFTVTTGAPKAYKYDMGSDMNKLSSFSKDVINYVANSKIIYKYSSSNFYNANIANLQYDVVYSARVNGSLYRNVVDGIKEGGATGTSYFESFNDYFKKYSFWK